MLSSLLFARNRLVNDRIILTRLANIAVVLIINLLVIILFLTEAQAQFGNGIHEPVSGDTVSGIVIINGTAEDPDFLRYELAFMHEFAPSTDWIVFAQGDRPVLEGTLAIWDTTVGGELSPVFPDGRYRLRLRVVRNDYNYDEYFTTGLIVANLSLTPTSTATVTQTIDETSITPLPATIIAATRDAGQGVLPTLTPFPTPTPGPTPINAASSPDSSNSDSENQGLFGQLADVDLGQFRTAFLYGVTIVAVAFIALAGYLILRTLVRWMLKNLGGR